MTSFSTGAKARPVLDQDGFQQLLAAAYVLQQHNETLRAKKPRLDTNWILSEISTTRGMVRDRVLSPETAALVVADRLRKITEAAAVSICVVRDGWLITTAESGSRGVGAIASRSQIATERLKNGREFHSSDAQKDIRVDTAQCRDLKVGSLLAVPIRQSEETLGLIEVRWNEVDAFHECDARTCELMAALITELVERERQASEIQLPPPEIQAETGARDEEIIRTGETRRSASDEPEARSPSAENPTQEESSGESRPASETTPENTKPELASYCRVCGRPFGPDEEFCGKCSLPRVAGDAAEGLQSKWASMWFMQQAQDAAKGKSIADAQPSFSSPAATKALDLDASVQPNVAGKSSEQGWEEAGSERVEPLRTFAPLRVRSVRSYPRDNGSAISALEEDAVVPAASDDAPSQGVRKLVRYILSHGITSVLAAAALGLAIILGTWLTRPTSPRQFTLFESLLVQLGLAEVPERTPVVQGNPDAKVWVDTHTALYYCQGSDLYGKTPGGRFSTQRIALQERFDSATGSPCD